MTITAIRALANRIGLGEDQKTRLVQPIEDVYAKLTVEIVTMMNEGGAAQVGRDTSVDPVLLALEPILRGRVGAPLSAQAHKQALTEARRRIAAKEPPGYKDAAKGEGHAEGDYLVWAQILREAKARGHDVLFVTADAKEDWWRSWGGTACAGPRLELLDEFNSEVGGRLFMLQPADLLAKASKILEVPVAEENVAEARRIDDSRAHPVSIYAFRSADGTWHGRPDMLADGSFAEATLEFDPVRSDGTARFAGQTLRVRFGHVLAEQSQVACQVVDDEGNLFRIRPTVQVQELLFHSVIMGRRDELEWLRRASTRLVHAMLAVAMHASDGVLNSRLFAPVERLGNVMAERNGPRLIAAVAEVLDAADTISAFELPAGDTATDSETAAWEAVEELRRAYTALHQGQ